MPKRKHLFIQGVPYSISDISFTRGTLQKERVKEGRATEYMMADLNLAPIPSAMHSNLGKIDKAMGKTYLAKHEKKKR